MAWYFGQPSGRRISESLETQIRRFHRSVRRRLRQLVRDSSRVGDLLFTHPCAAFVLVAGNRTPESRGRALRLVKDGRQLNEVEEVLDLPRWSRRLSPEVLVKPLGSLPDARGFGNCAIPEPEDDQLWLERLSYCAEICDDSMALWLARKRLCDSCCSETSALLPLGAFVWYSQQRKYVAAKLMEKPWNRKMRFSTVVEAALAWYARVIFSYCRGAIKIGLSSRKYRGYRFLPLRTAAELEEEGQAMEHCVADYADHVAAGTRLIFSIRRGKKRMATMDIVPTGNGMATAIHQLKSVENAEPEERVIRAAESWLKQHSRFTLTLDAERWKEVWQPYCTAKPQLAFYFLEALEQVLPKLCSDLNTFWDWHEF